MAVSSLFDSALQAVMRDLPSYEPQLSYLPGAVKARLARVMARRGLLCDRNIMTVSQWVYELLWEKGRRKERVRVRVRVRVSE